MVTCSKASPVTKNGKAWASQLLHRTKQEGLEHVDFGKPTKSQFGLVVFEPTIAISDDSHAQKFQQMAKKWFWSSEPVLILKEFLFKEWIYFSFVLSFTVDSC